MNSHLLRNQACRALYHFRRSHELCNYRWFCQSNNNNNNKNNNSNTNTNDGTTNTKKPIESSRIRKPSHFYQQHKPKTEQSKVNAPGGTGTTNIRGKPIAPVTSASIDRPTPQFSDHQYSRIKSSLEENEDAYKLGPGTVPHETVGDGVQEVTQIGSPAHVRSMLMSMSSSANNTGVSSATMVPTPSIEEQFVLFFKGIKSSIKNSSIFSKLITLSLIGLILFGDYLDSLFNIKRDKDPNNIYAFLSGSGEESIMNNLKTGDIIVFQSPLLSYNILNTIRVIIRQFVCDGPYDHCGIILCNKHDSDFPYVLEVNQNQWLAQRWFYKLKSLFIEPEIGSLKNIKITSFDERVITARENTVFVRQVARVHVDPKINEQLSDWVDYVISQEEHKQEV